ncbi:sodium:solute symporter [Capnocytophaga sp. ARDL2]|uniref:sodium:solute symporter n=1 Tax=Capnocytophaga sp. ARDL2 TaxID=3238809 RepID=UPI003557DD70
MSATVILSIFIIYFLVLISISHFIGKKDSSNQAFFSANRNSKWYLVAFGMIGTALSGVTFISVPGEVGAAAGNQFKYFQFVLGNAVGFIITATVLLPLYYRLQLTSIYEFFENRMGNHTYKTASGIFLISRSIGSAFRLYLVVIVLQRFVFDELHVPFVATVAVSLALIYAYTYKAGLKTIVITDTLQTFFIVASVVFTIIFVSNQLNFSLVEAFEKVKNSGYSKIFFWEDFIENKFHFSKQFIGGIFITIATNGLDQDIMQKSLSCSNIKDAQKNMFSFTTIFVIINLLFLGVGALLYLYAEQQNIGIPTDAMGNIRTDLLFPYIAFNDFSFFPALIFLLGLIAATFATTDSAITALTTSFCVDFLGMQKRKDENNAKDIRTRKLIHLAFCFVLFAIIVIFNSINDASVVSMIFKVASYTYGPLLGLFAFGIFVKNRQVIDKIVPFICIAAPLICLWISYNSQSLTGYAFDNEIIVINGLVTFIGLYLISKPKQ